MKKITKLGIIGLGASFKYRVNAIKNNQFSKLVGIAGNDKSRAKCLADEYNIPFCASSVKDLIESSEIDAVIIAVPPIYQPEIAGKSLNNGKHVLCEKPLGINREQIDKLISVWEKSRLIGMVNFCYRFITEIVQFKSHLENGICGNVHLIDAQWILNNRLNTSLKLNWKGLKELGGGVLQNYGVHVIDYLFHDIDNVKVIGSKQLTLKTAQINNMGFRQLCTGDDITNAIFCINNKNIVNLSLSLVTTPPIGHRVSAYGSTGTLVLENLNVTSPSGPFTLHLFKEDSINGECLSTLSNSNNINLSSLFTDVIDRFVDAIMNNDLEAEPSFYSGHKAFQIINRIQHKNLCNSSDNT